MRTPWGRRRERAARQEALLEEMCDHERRMAWADDVEARARALVRKGDMAGACDLMSTTPLEPPEGWTP